jgi:hypothetical protein
MATPSPAAIATPPVPVQEPNTFDQALDQRRRAQSAEGTIPAGLVDLGEKALRISDHMHGTGQSVAPPASDVPGRAMSSHSAAAGQAKQPSGDELMTRAKQLIDSSFGYAVLTQQVVRGANQLASGMMTLLRST